MTIEFGVFPTLIYAQLQLYNSSCYFLVEILSYLAAFISIIFLIFYFYFISYCFIIVAEAEVNHKVAMNDLKDLYDMIIHEQGHFPVEYN